MRSSSDWPVAFSCSWNRKRQSGNWGVCQACQQGDHVIGDLGSPFRVRPSDETQPYEIAAGNHRQMCSKNMHAQCKTGETLFGRDTPRYSIMLAYFYSTTSVELPNPPLTNNHAGGRFSSTQITLIGLWMHLSSSSRCRGAPHEDRLSIVHRSMVEIQHRGATSKLLWQLLSRPVSALSHEIQKSRNLATIAKTRCLCVGNHPQFQTSTTLLFSFFSASTTPSGRRTDRIEAPGFT